MDDEIAGGTPGQGSAGPPAPEGAVSPAEGGRPEPGGAAAPQGEAPTEPARPPAGEAPAAPVSPDAGATEATVVASAAAEEPTRVMGAETTDATRVVPPAGATAPPTGAVAPPAGAAAPPPGAAPAAPPKQTWPQPTLRMTHPPKQSSSTLWIVILVIVAAVVAAAAVWYFLIRPKSTPPAPTPSPTPTLGFAWAGAWGRTDGGGGGLVIQKTGTQYQVTMYDGTLQVLGVAVATTQGTSLNFFLNTQATLAGLPGPFRVTLAPGAGPDLASMNITGANGNALTLQLKRVAALMPATPSPSPTTSPPSSPSPSPTPSPSTASAEQLLMSAVQRIQIGVITWATNNNNLYPAPAEVTETGGVATYVDPWPVNPYNNQPMKPGTQAGDYIYQQLNGGSGYQLTGYLANGLTYTVP